jgi:hypothetical protein
MADLAIDKTTNSAINFIESQPAHCQEAIATAWITGATIIADAVCVCLKEMEDVETHIDDFIRLESSWTSIQNSVDAAISALRGIFNLMANSARPNTTRDTSVSPGRKASDAYSIRSRQSSISIGSIGSSLGMIKRALSTSHVMSPPPLKSSWTGSLPVPEANARGFRMSMSAACPTRMPNYLEQHTMLTPIPHTPREAQTPENTMSPFKDRNDYFNTFDMGKNSDSANKETSASQDLMQL